MKINPQILFRFTFLLLFLFSCDNNEKAYNDGVIKYKPIILSVSDKQIVSDYINQMKCRYDDKEKMITHKITEWNYHTDALSGTFHAVRSSFEYAVALLNSGEEKYKRRAFDVIEKTISLQDTNPNSRSCGVWPYFLEEPLSTKKSPIDYNWADFNAVSLLDIYMGHKDKLPKDLLKKVESSLILAAKAVKKRNCGPGYTNIAIMGTYVTYVTSHLFNIPDMKEYAVKRLKTFYNYTLEKGGFSEYNSPTYSIVAIDELNRMQNHIVEPEAKRMIDDLYSRCWSIIARHYHKKMAQWAGPHSRCYSTFVNKSFYGILNEASDGKIDLGYKPSRNSVLLKHKIPDHLLHYFSTPKYPRTEIDVFEKELPQIIGTSYLAEDFALSTSSRSSLWNQRRPLLAYWGTQSNASYLQVRFLHDFYDFSTAVMFAQQKENKVLAGINLATNGGDKHINIDIIKNGLFKAKDLRLRFELGNCKNIDVNLPSKLNDEFSIKANNMNINLELLANKFVNNIGYWEKGTDGVNSWVDFVIYSGKETEFNLYHINSAYWGIALTMGSDAQALSINNAQSEIKGNVLNLLWNDLSVSLPIKPKKYPSHL